MNFIKKLEKKKCVKLILDFDCVLFMIHKKKIVKAIGLLKDCIDKEESFGRNFLYNIEIFREKTLKQEIGNTEKVPFIIRSWSKLYGYMGKLEKILSNYNVNKIMKNLFLENIKRLRVEQLVIDNFY